MIEAQHELFKQVKGFLDTAEGEALYAITGDAGKLGPCLEIGSYCGKSTICIGTACRETNSTLFTIDHHTGSEEQQPGEEYFDPDLFDYQTFQVDTLTTFRDTLRQANLLDTVVPLVCQSHVAARHWETRLALVFIDGGHAAETVRLDYDAWAHHVMPGGYLVFHDIFIKPEEGGQAPFDVYRSALSSGRFIEKPMVKTLGILRRKF
ncbi:class I SAM-dependent methyltransferase [Thermodesulfobacteriota bacterium]